MRRIRLPLGRRLFLLAATLAALVLTLPLRLAGGALGLGEAGVSAREATGSVWSGRLVEARVGSVPVGDVAAALRPLPLAVGRARVDLAGGTGGADEAPARAGVAVSRHSLALVDATVRLPVARLLAPLPVREVVLTDVSARFRDGVCEAAEGAVRADLAGDAAGTGLPGSFAGSPRCEAGALLLPLASAGGERLTIRLLGGGRYRAELALRPGDPAATARLAATGFAPGPDGAPTLAIDGSW